jgi:hypothetical protein
MPHLAWGAAHTFPHPQTLNHTGREMKQKSKDNGVNTGNNVFVTSVGQTQQNGRC